MNPKIKTKWLSALRSGEYRQGFHHLNKNNKFCCLGVLCDLYAKENNVEWKMIREGVLRLHNSNTEALPSEVVAWAGLTGANPIVEEAGLARHNDRGATFTKIADMIEKNL